MWEGDWGKGRTMVAREASSNVVLGGFEGEGAWGVEEDILFRGRGN